MDTKTCKVCGETKPLDNFYRDKGWLDGRTNRCKVCKNKKTAQWREKNREKYNADMRKYNHKHYQRLRIMRYKLTPEQHAEIMAAQNGVCAICQKKPKHYLCVDHCHESGKVRGLLCHACNRHMVLVDSPELLARAIAYKSANPVR